MPLHATDSPDVFALVQKSCVGCHSAAVKSGDVDLATLRTAKTFGDDREIWEKVVEKLKLGQMPPQVCRGRRPKLSLQSRIGWSLSSRGRIARSSRNQGASPPTGSIAPNTTTPSATFSVSTFVRRTTFRRTPPPTVSTISA